MEIWKPVIIEGIKDYYEVSSKGNFRNKITGKILTQTKDKGGYLTIGFARKVKKGKQKQQRFLAHRIVAAAFVYNNDPSTLTTVNHVNGDKTNNNFWNLEWMTNADNVKDMYKSKRHKTLYGTLVGNNKYSEKQIHKVCKMLENEYSDTEIKEITGVPKNIIGFVKRRVIWTHISKEYNFRPPKKRFKMKKIYVFFTKLIKKGYTWKEVKNMYDIHGKKTKPYREIFHKLEDKFLD